IAAAGLQLARDVLGDLTRRRALLAGLGEMGEFMAGELLRAGISDLVVLHESLERAEAAARRLGSHFRPWEELEPALVEADVVVAASGTGRYRIAPGPVEAALRRRRREPIFLIDAAVPGDIDPAVGALDEAFVYDLADLERVALSGKAAREASLGEAEAILERELAAFLRARAERGAAPAVVALRRHFEAARDEVLADGASNAEDSTRRLVNRLLHDPFEVLRQAAVRRAEQGDSAEEPLEAALRRLFRLDVTRPEDKDAGGPEDG
ncbi:MAG TPA: NAD(P)-binding domain-containing protein, partial [Kiloniellales bacterium]|nr:NAD(P)-binding domain-containing protein [Kiloniellales bacterium]